MNKIFKNASAIFAATLFCAAIFISCEEKKESTTTTTTPEVTTAAPDSMMPMDTGSTRPVLTEQ